LLRGVRSVCAEIVAVVASTCGAHTSSTRSQAQLACVCVSRVAHGTVTHAGARQSTAPSNVGQTSVKRDATLVKQVHEEDIMLVKGPTGAPERKPFDTRHESSEREWFLVRWRAHARAALCGVVHVPCAATASKRPRPHAERRPPCGAPLCAATLRDAALRAGRRQWRGCQGHARAGGVSLRARQCDGGEWGCVCLWWLCGGCAVAVRWHASRHVLVSWVVDPWMHGWGACWRASGIVELTHTRACTHTKNTHTHTHTHTRHTRHTR
jgi:hypothetical protein